MLDGIITLDRAHIEELDFIFKYESHYNIFKKICRSHDISRCAFSLLKMILKEYDLILSRSGSGSINEILYYTNNAYFVPHIKSRDQHQKFNLNYFLTHNMCMKKFSIPNKKID